jgi:hypothetical protein
MHTRSESILNYFFAMKIYRREIMTSSAASTKYRAHTYSATAADDKKYHVMIRMNDLQLLTGVYFVAVLLK